LRLDKNSTEERTVSRYESEMGEVVGGGGFAVYMVAVVAASA
jgi:hypothetical protein